MHLHPISSFYFSTDHFINSISIGMLLIKWFLVQEPMKIEVGFGKGDEREIQSCVAGRIGENIPDIWGSMGVKQKYQRNSV